MSKRHLTIIESIAADKKRDQALFLLDCLNLDELEASERVQAVDLKARICVQEGRYDEAKEAWEAVLKEDETHAGAIQGVALLKRREKDKLFALRIGLARIFSDYGSRLAGVVAAMMIIIWFVALQMDVQKSISLSKNIQASQAPGGEFYAAVETKIKGISAQNDRLKTVISQMQEESAAARQKQGDEILAKLAAYSNLLETNYSSRIQKSEENFQEQIVRIEGKTELSRNDIVRLEAGQKEEVKRDAQFKQQIDRLQKNVEEMLNRMDKMAITTASGMENQQKLEGDFKLAAEKIAALQISTEKISKTLAELQKQLAQVETTVRQEIKEVVKQEGKNNVEKQGQAAE